MGFRFFRRMKIAPGVSLNFSKSGVSPSFGVRGARVTLGRQGVRKTVGIPGTGLFYTEVAGTRKGSGGAAERGRGREDSEPEPLAPQPHHRLDLGFFDRLWISPGERAFVDGCKAYVQGRRDEAFDLLASACELADAAFLAGFLALDAARWDRAANLLEQAHQRRRQLGVLFEKYGMSVELSMPISPCIAARIRPSRRGVLLGLAEAHQAAGRIRQALDALKMLRRSAPDDIAVKVSIAELITEAQPSDKRLARQVVDLVGEISNGSSLHAAAMLYKARALRTLGLLTAARATLTSACRRTRGRDPELLRALRYERACIYEALGRRADARRAFEKLYAECPAYEDVAQRLGLPAERASG